MTIEETAIVNAVIPVLFIFTPPLAGFLADKMGNFRLLLCFLTGSGGLVSLLLLLIPTGRFISYYSSPNKRLFMSQQLHCLDRKSVSGCTDYSTSL